VRGPLWTYISMMGRLNYLRLRTDIDAQCGGADQLRGRVGDLGGAVEGVEKAYLVYGVFDIVAIITSATMDGLEGALMQKVRTIPGVRRTMTLMISRSCLPL
jgi:DNA-binding Lrp family transcriptional regulator